MSDLQPPDLTQYWIVLTTAGAKALAKRLRDDYVDVKTVLDWLADHFQDDMDQLIQLHQLLDVPISSKHLLAYRQARMKVFEDVVEAAWGADWKRHFKWDDQACGFKRMLTVRKVALVS